MNEIDGSHPFRGVWAALLTPRGVDREVNRAALSTLVRFLCSRGIAAFAANGATGEYCLTTPQQLRVILAAVQEAAAGKAKILCGIGAPGTSLAIELAAVAEAAGADGLLLPMPYFFPYEQQDLEHFCREVAAATTLPILLYNLPQFTSGLQADTVRRLVQEVPNILGVKDSANSVEILLGLTESGVDARRMVGNDSMLAEALREGLCDGVVSGVACVLPELMTAFYALRATPDSAEFRRASELLQEFVARVNAFPTPWGLKWVAEARGLCAATFAQPVSQQRAAAGAALCAWATQWFPAAMSELGLRDTAFELTGEVQAS